MAKIIADLHLHSKYSRAVSPKMELAEIWRWAKIKGIDLAATGDWTHPLWLREIQGKLEEDPEKRGLFRLKKEYRPMEAESEKEPLFLLSTEISSIYTQGGQGRRIHTLVWLSGLEAVEKFNQKLLERGANLMSDGRPIVGLPAKQILELALEADELALVIPAHVWTPWFSLYGSKSGFDSIKECFGDLAPYIQAVETGLSSDPAMNWRVEELDRRAIVSFSDAHSGSKLGREATVFEMPKGQLSFKGIREAVLAETKPHIAYTIEFYPEEGKYHYSGHRNCQVKHSIEETRKIGTTCPVCGKGLTLGVEYRVEQLATREVSTQKIEGKNGLTGIRADKKAHPELARKPPYVMLVPLQEILAEALEVGAGSQKIGVEYSRLVNHFGGEFKILLETELEELAKIAEPRIVEALERVRRQNIFIDPGADGEFGKVKIWGKKELGVENNQEQLGLDI